MTFQYTIKKCKISVDRKKYTKNDISISDRYMFIHYSKPKGYSGKVMVNMEKPSEQVSKIEYDGTDHILRFTWTGLWEDEDTGKESKKTLQFKIDFERPVDGSRVYLALIGKPLTIKKGKKTHRAPGIITRKFKSKKYDWKGQKEKIKKRKLRIKTKNKGLKQIMKNISDEKILQVARNKPLIRSDAPDSEIIKEAKRDPRMYFTKEELLRHAKGGGSSKKSCKRRRVRKMKDGSYNQEDIDHNKKCEKNMIKDNPWMLDKSVIETTKQLYPKLVKSKRTKKKDRKGPEESATEYSVGEEKQGNDGNMWVIQVSKNGIQRWVKKEDKSARGKNKPLEKLWTDMSNMKKLVFIMKYKQLDGSYYKIHKIKRTNYQDKIDEGNNTPSVKVILTAGNSFDGYQQLYDDVGKSSVEQVLKNYKKYWKHKMDDKLYTC